METIHFRKCAMGIRTGSKWPDSSFIIQLDEARAELPLTADKQDTFPIGVALETGSTHQLTIGNLCSSGNEMCEIDILI